ncbi:MAG: ABC transporter ATP-binding protein [Acidobacteriota bacterium]
MNKKVNQWNFYLKYYQGNYKKIGLSIALSIIQSVVLIPAVILIKNIFDKVLPGKNFNELILYSVLILIIYIFNGLISLATRMISLKTTKSVIQKLRDRIIEKVLLLPKSFLAEEKKAQLHTVIVQDTLRIDIMSNALLSQIIPSVFISLGLLGILLYLNLFLLSVLLLTFPAIYFFSRYVGKIFQTRISVYHRYFEKFSHRTITFLNFIDFIRIRSNEKKEKDHHKKIHSVLNEKSFMKSWIGGIYSVFNRTAIGISGIILLLAGGYLVIKGNLSTGSLISFFATTGFLKNYLLVVSNVIPKVIEGNESLKTVFELISRREKIPYSGKKKIEFKGKIEIKNLSFKYEGSDKIIKNFSLIINPGDTLSIVGPNGSGKTSLTYLLLGFYKPLSGEILADGTPFNKLDIRYLRKFIGVVSQDPYIIPGTIYENLVYGLGDISQERVEKVLKLSLCDQFVNKKPDGIDTFIGAKGHLLSRGEIQRIALARVMLGDFKFIILDEPGNHLNENITELILNNCKKLESNPSILLITHRKSISEISDSVIGLNNSEYMKKVIPGE